MARRRFGHGLALVATVALALSAAPSVEAQEILLTGPLVGPRTYAPKGGDTVRVDIGAIGPFVTAVTSSSPSALVGGGAAFNVSFKLWLWYEVEAFVAFSGNEQASVTMAGGLVAARLHPTERFGFGAGAAAGGLIEDGHDVLESSPFVGPVAIPVSYWFDCCHLEGRVALFWSETHEDGVRDLRPSVLMPYLTFTFGLTVAPEAEKRGPIYEGS